MYYTVYTNSCLETPFAAYRSDVTEYWDLRDGYILYWIPAPDDSLFVKVGVSRGWVRPGSLFGEGEDQTLTITFRGNGGTGEMEDQTVEGFDTEFALSKCLFTRAGHVFAGWSRSEDGPVEFTNEQVVSDMRSSWVNHEVLYAVWHEQGGATGLAISYYDASASSNSFSTYSSMQSFFAALTPSLEASTLDFGDTLDSAITGMSSYDRSRLSNYGFQSFFSTTGTSSGRLHGAYANSSKNSFCAHVSGEISVSASGTHSFGMAADDGAVLYIDGSRVCSASWGSEGSGTVSLSAGTHSSCALFSPVYWRQSVAVL